MKTITAVIIIVVIAAIGYGVYHSHVNTTDSTITQQSTSTPMEDPTTGTSSEMNVNAQGLGIQILKPGTGATAKVGDTVAVNYVGKLENGTVFDASANHGGPFSFTLGSHQVIEGWEQGVLGMQVGEQRRLNIPASLGYGAAGAGGVIPPNATLIFDVELVAIQ